MVKYRINEVNTLHDGTWFVVEYYKTFLIGLFNHWRILQRPEYICSRGIGGPSDICTDVKFKNQIEAQNYIRELKFKNKARDSNARRTVNHNCNE